MGSEQVNTTRESRMQLLKMLGIGTVASVIGIVAGLAIDWFPLQASEEARQIDTLWDILLSVSVPIFVMVEAVVLYCVWKFRMKPGEELKDGPPIHGNTRVEIIWTAIPTLILLVLCIYAYVVLDDIEEAKADTMNVRVVGEQFAWTFYYPGEGNEEIASNQLYLPLGRTISFDVQTKDVIHDFWVPAFRMKIDAVPGTTQHVQATPNRRGTYPVVCAELCGIGHAVMRQSAHVIPPTAFQSWLTKQAESGNATPGATAGNQGQPGEAAELDGKQLFTGVQPSCGACHTLADAGTNSSIGPNLDDSLEGKDAEYIRQSIVEPEAEIASGFQGAVMPPNYDETLKPEEVDALVKYLVKVTK